MKFRTNLSAVLLLASSARAEILGVASAKQPFALDQVASKPEAGPVPLVQDDHIAAFTAPVAIRLTGANRAVLGLQSEADIRPFRENGAFFYLRKGSLRFDALREPMAICAENKLYIPKVSASGEVVILEDKKVKASTSAGVFEQHGKGEEACNSKAAALLLNGGAGTIGAVGGAAGSTAAAGAAAATTATIAPVATAAASGVAASTIAAAASSGVGSGSSQSGTAAPPFVSASTPQ